eukprot:3335121-Amphidinium_carterae.1
MAGRRLTRHQHHLQKAATADKSRPGLRLTTLHCFRPTLIGLDWLPQPPFGLLVGFVAASPT